MPTGGGASIFKGGGHEARKGTQLHRELMAGHMHDIAHHHPVHDMNQAIAEIVKGKSK